MQAICTAVRRLACFTEEVQLERMTPLIASPPRQKVATHALTEQTNCRSAAGAHSDLQAGRGAAHAEDGLCTAVTSNLIRVQESLRRLFSQGT